MMGAIAQSGTQEPGDRRSRRRAQLRLRSEIERVCDELFEAWMPVCAVWLLRPRRLSAATGRRIFTVDDVLRAIENWRKF